MEQKKVNWLKYSLIYAKAGLQSKFLKRKPIFLTVFVTARCGLNCGHCFYREELLQGDIHQEMKLWEYEKLTQKSLSFPKLIITGGEPFLRSDLKEIVHCFYHNASKSRQITIPTAGQHPDHIEELVKTSLRNCPELILEIQLSIDGIYEDHDRIRGKGQFAKLMESYHRLAPIQQENQRLRIRFNYTFSAQSQKHFPKTYRFVVEELKNPHFDMVLVRKNTADPKYFQPVDMTLYRNATAMLQEQERRKAQGTLEEILAERAGIEREIIANHYTKERVLSNCQAGTLTAILSETGELRPCEILDTSIGNVRDVNYDMNQLWNNTQSKAHRQHIKNTKCFCTFETNVRTTMVFQPKWLLKTLGSYIQTEHLSK